MNPSEYIAKLGYRPIAFIGKIATKNCPNWEKSLVIYQTNKGKIMLCMDEIPHNLPGYPNKFISGCEYYTNCAIIG